MSSLTTLELTREEALNYLLEALSIANESTIEREIHISNQELADMCDVLLLDKLYNCSVHN